MTLLQFFAILRARAWVVLGVLVLAVVGTGIVNALLPREYASTAAVLVDVKSPDPIAGIFYPGLTSPSYMATQVDVIQSDRVSQGVVRALRLDQAAESREQWREATRGQGNYESWLAARLRRSLDVKPSRESNVISITYKSPDPRFATALANAYAKAFVDITLELRVEPARQYGRFFDDRVKLLRERVEQARERISAFQREHGIVASDERFDVENARLNELSTQVTLLQSQRAESRSRAEQAKSASDRVPDTLNSGLIASLRADLSRQESKLSEMSSRLGDAHPSFLEQQAGVDELRRRLALETARVSGGASVADNINESRVAQVRAALDAQRTKVLRLKSVRDELAVLNGDLDTAQRAFDQVSSRANLSDLESRATLTNIHVLNPASEPTAPASPRVTLNMVLAVFVGTLLGVAAAMLLELFDRRLRSPSDVVQALDLKPLGVLPDRLRGRLLRGRTATRAALPRHRLASAARRLGAEGFRRTVDPRLEAGDGDASDADRTQAPDAHDARPIGHILRDSKLLTDTDIEQVLAHQRQHRLRFGESAIALQLVSEPDLRRALAHQFRYARLDSPAAAGTAELVVATEGHDDLAEAFRSLRSQLGRALARAPRRIVAIVGLDPGDGKTFTALNLACAFSQLGGRTLLIEADLRTPRIAAALGLEREPGLSAALAGLAPVRPAVPLAGLPNLHVLAAGPTPPNPLELLESAAFARLLDDVARSYDHVIVDTPPHRVGADAAVVVHRAGAFVAVARSGRTRIDALQAMVEAMREPGIAALGVVMNGGRSAT